MTAPTLLIVGGLDHEVMGLNETALNKLDCRKELRIVPGAGHLFEQAGTLDIAVDRALDWFGKDWPAPIGGSGLIVSASSAFGPLARCFPGRSDGSRERCAA